MRTQDEIEYAVARVKERIEEMDTISCPSEKAAAYAQLPKERATLEAFEWTLQGERTELIIERYFVPSINLAAFRELVANYDAQELEDLAQQSEEDYNDWKDSAEPGESYPGYTENNPGPQFVPRVTIALEAEAFGGSFFELRFPETHAALVFGYDWCSKLKRQQEERDAKARLEAGETELFVMWAGVGPHKALLYDQICTLEQAKELVRLGCPPEGPSWAWWREYGSHIPPHRNLDVNGQQIPFNEFAQVAKWTAIEKARKMPDLFFPAWTADELWAMFPKVAGRGPTWYAGPSRLGGWYCKQTNGRDFAAPTQAQAVAAMLIYLLKNKAKFYPEQQEGSVQQ